MFTITSHKGFYLKFKNGFTISVQWGPGNYCEHYGTGDWNAPREADRWDSYEAEIAIFDENDNFVSFSGRDDCCDDVRGRLNTDQVAQVIALVQSAWSVENLQESLTIL